MPWARPPIASWKIFRYSSRCRSPGGAVASFPLGDHLHQAVVGGYVLAGVTRQVFEDLRVESDGANTGLSGELDQAGLFGVLARIMEFGLELTIFDGGGYRRV